MGRRAIVYGLIFCLAILGFSQEELDSPLSSEILIPDLFRDGTNTFDAKDLFRFATLWFLTVDGAEEGDLNGDRMVDANDLLPLIHAYSENLSPSNSTSSEDTPTPISSFDTPTSIPTSTSTPTPLLNTTPTLLPTPTPTLDINGNSPTPTMDPGEDATPGMDTTSTPTYSASPIPEESTGTATETPLSGFTKTPTLDPTLTSTWTSTPLLSITPTLGPSATPTRYQSDSSPTPEETSVSTPTVNPGSTNTPTPAPTGGSNPTGEETPTVYQPEFVRLWNLHPSFSLFSDLIHLPSAGGYASSSLGYTVGTTTQAGEETFITFDRFGRIFNRNLPLSLSDASGVELVDGGSAFGKFFESPYATRRFRFDRFSLESVVSNVLEVEHLGADSIAWAFCGGEKGYAMAVLRYPRTLAVHRIGAEGEYLGVSEHSISSDLPTRPAVVMMAMSNDRIAVVYSNNQGVGGKSAPLVVWIFSLQGELLTSSPLVLVDEPGLNRLVGDDHGTFYLVTQSIYGPRLNRFSPNGLLLNRILSSETLVDIQWHDGLLWLLDGGNHTMKGLNEDGQIANGPVFLYPTGWDKVPQWLRLKKNGPDLGAFFTASSAPNSVHYMQIEAGSMVTPTPLPAPGVPTGVTAEIVLKEGVTIELIKIARGTYLRGSPDNELGRRSNEGPQHSVTLTYDFFMSKTEITHRQYRVFNPGKKNAIYMGVEMNDEDMPVVGVTWQNAYDYCKWLSNQSEYTFSLPSEAEWEYAARAGSTTRRPWSEDLSDLEKSDEIDRSLCLYANVADVRAASAFTTMMYYAHGDDGYVVAAPVGSFPPNALGLYDMLGNVREWCMDWFARYDTQTLVDPMGPETGSSRIIRGGSWLSHPDFARSAYRSGSPPETSDASLGFRVVIRDE